MVGYTTIGSNDLPRATAFFDALFSEFGAKQLMNNGRMVMYGKSFGNGILAVCTPFDKQKATSGNGVMIALNMETEDAVHKLHAKALALGAKDEGAPGQRGPGFYGGYFRDLDGNKICGFKMGA